VYSGVPRVNSSIHLKAGLIFVRDFYMNVEIDPFDNVSPNF